MTVQITLHNDCELFQYHFQTYPSPLKKQNQSWKWAQMWVDAPYLALGHFLEIKQFLMCVGQDSSQCSDLLWAGWSGD